MSNKHTQGGGFVLGLIVGLLVGLAVALAVALYITKVPIPYINKVPQRSAEQDAAEAQKNRNWDPNAGLQGKSASRPGAAASAASPASAPASGAAPTTTATAAAAADGGAATTRDPAAILAGAADPVAPNADKGSVSTRPFLLQAGAYQRVEDAQAQRAKLALLGIEARIIDREQSGGRIVYRVRMGPYEKRSDAELVKDKLAASGVESLLMQAQSTAP
jgi:cell division protein FtsN